MLWENRNKILTAYFGGHYYVRLTKYRFNIFRK